MEFLATEDVNQVKGINLKEFADKFDIQKAESYLFEARDGYSVEIEASDLESGIVFINEEGEVAIEFAGMPRSKAIKDLEFIAAILE